MKIQLIIASLCVCAVASAQTVYQLSEPMRPKEIVKGHLNMGGTSPDGGSIEVNSYFLSFDGKPEIPVTGEFHFSRYPCEQWEEEIIKIKAGGITVVPTYVFWSLHEEEEGVWNWSEDKNLRHFVELCGKYGLKVIVRLGPFCHGEIRNGSLPDWLFAKPVNVRSNQPLYLSYVRKLYQQIALQLEGLYYKDGGPVIACQIENEMQHSAAPWGINYPGEPVDNTVASYDVDYAAEGVSVISKEIATSEIGEEHMRTLLSIAKECGLITPFYTATGWGMATVIDNEALPVTAAYTYPFWGDIEMSPFLMFKDIQKVPDYSPVRYNTELFPSFCAEMGVGIQMIYSRRPIVTAQAAQALMVRTLGSGSNAIGYYMYHGGSTPLRKDGIGSYQDEPMGMPKISYDYQAPLGEFGLEHPSYRYLRTIHSFLSDFGSELAPMEVVLPETYETMTPDNRDDLRYAARIKDGSGFLFMVNFQDHDPGRHDMADLQIKLNLRYETLSIPRSGGFTLPKDASVILPFNIKLGNALLKYATAQPLMKIDDNGIDHYIFFAPEGMKPQYCFDASSVRGKSLIDVTSGMGSTFTVTSRNGSKIRITTLTHEQALDAVKIDNKLLITKASVLPTAEGTVLQQLADPCFEYVLYPSAKAWATQFAEVEAVEPEVKVEKITERRYVVEFSKLPKTAQVKEYFLDVDYTGDVALAFQDNKLIGDHFWFGQDWLIGLNRFAASDMNFYFRPLRNDATYIQDIPKKDMPDFGTGASVLSVNSIKLLPQYQLML